MQSRKPLYKQQDRVLYTSLKKHGIVQCVINIDDKKDIKHQGFRYEVLIKGMLHSVPEHSLQMAK